MNLLVIYSNFDSLPVMFLVPPTDNYYKRLSKANNIIINAFHDGDEAFEDVVAKISEIAYAILNPNHLTRSETETYDGEFGSWDELKELVSIWNTYLVKDKIAASAPCKIVNVGFSL